MSTITKERLEQLANFRGAPVTRQEEQELARIALASLEAEPVAYIDPFTFKNFSTFRAGETDNKRMGREWAWANPDAGLVPVYTAPPAPVSVPKDIPDSVFEVLCQASGGGGKACDFADELWNACRAAMLQGAEPVTTKDDGGRYEQDDSPECGWVVTHSGKDYFYREQKDAVMHMNSAVESGLGVSLRSFIPEPVSEHHKLNDLVIPDAYDIEAFGIFSATEGESGLLLQIEQFWFGTENCPQVGKENMVPKFALQAIINRLQAHCNSMGEDTLIDIFASSAAPQQEVK
ncbi:hypothetical protein [Enterobacter roggenkampii]|uniref:hypothetical protein n=1 Tax=Enterobacter roggenkampii TaxID=1812935 RepID=UPI00123B0F37|nr:hypothetical protein [Enterobacter roggenkampii]MCK6768131.1 hypothetical protein [Enterobacter roggenkampii]HDS5358210.1 hypothetical protein [Enterobacter roggenkampii]